MATEIKTIKKEDLLTVIANSNQWNKKGVDATSEVIIEKVIATRDAKDELIYIGAKEKGAKIWRFANLVKGWKAEVDEIPIEVMNFSRKS